MKETVVKQIQTPLTEKRPFHIMEGFKRSVTALLNHKLQEQDKKQRVKKLKDETKPD